MPTVIKDEQRRGQESDLASTLSEILPQRLYEEIRSQLCGYRRAEEVRCRLGKPSYITAAGENVRLSHVTDESDMKRMTDRIFGGSLYAHRESLTEGYITLQGGIRVGICGRAVIEGGEVRGVYDITSLNFRLPCAVYSATGHIEGLLRQGKGALIYSLPGVGKTTLLRSLSAQLSTGSGALRVCVVDTRGELSMSQSALGGADVLVGYPKGVGIEIATRCFSPQLIVCDEIGSESEAEAILSASNCGVPILASAHGDSVGALMRRAGLYALHRAQVFSYYVGLYRRGSRMEQDIVAREDIGDIF